MRAAAHSPRSSNPRQSDSEARRHRSPPAGHLSCSLRVDPIGPLPNPGSTCRPVWQKTRGSPLAHHSLGRLLRVELRTIWTNEPAHVTRIRRILYMLRSARQPSGMDQPGFRLHPLRGEYQGHRGIAVSGNWRIAFRFEASEAIDFDLVDYH